MLDVLQWVACDESGDPTASYACACKINLCKMQIRIFTTLLRFSHNRAALSRRVRRGRNTSYRYLSTR